MLPSSDDSGTTGSAGEKSPRGLFPSPPFLSPRGHGHLQQPSGTSSLQTLPKRRASSSQLAGCLRSQSLVSGHSRKASTAEELSSARRALSMTSNDRRRTDRNSVKSLPGVPRDKARFSCTSSDAESSASSLVAAGGLSQEEEEEEQSGLQTRSSGALLDVSERKRDRTALSEVGLRLKQQLAMSHEGEEREEEEGEEKKVGDRRWSLCSHRGDTSVAGSAVFRSPSTLSVSKGDDFENAVRRYHAGKHSGNGPASQPTRHVTGSGATPRETFDGRGYRTSCLTNTTHQEDSEYTPSLLSKESSRVLVRDSSFPVLASGSRTGRMLRFHPGYTAGTGEEVRGEVVGEAPLYSRSSPSESEGEVAECVSRDVDDDAAAIRAQLQLPQLLLLHADEVEKNVWLLPPEYEEQNFVSARSDDSGGDGRSGGERGRGRLREPAEAEEYGVQRARQGTGDGAEQEEEPSGERGRSEDGLAEERKTSGITQATRSAQRRKTQERETSSWSSQEKAEGFRGEGELRHGLFHPEQGLEVGGTPSKADGGGADQTLQGRSSDAVEPAASCATVPSPRSEVHADYRRLPDPAVAGVRAASQVPATWEQASPPPAGILGKGSGSESAGLASLAYSSSAPGAETEAARKSSAREKITFSDSAGSRSSSPRKRSSRHGSSVRAASAGPVSFFNTPSFRHSSTFASHNTSVPSAFTSALSWHLSESNGRRIPLRRPAESARRFERAHSCGVPGAFGLARSMTGDSSSLLPRPTGQAFLSAAGGLFASSHSCSPGPGSSRLLPREDSVERLGIGKLGKEVLLRQQRQWLAAQQASNSSRQRRLLSRRHTLGGRLFEGFSRQLSPFPLRRGRTGAAETFGSLKRRTTRAVTPEVDPFLSFCSNNFSEAFLAAEGLEAPLLLRQLKERKKQEKVAHAEERGIRHEAHQGEGGSFSLQCRKGKPARTYSRGDSATFVENPSCSRTRLGETGSRSLGVAELAQELPKLRRSLTVFSGAGRDTQGSSKLARAAAKAARELVSFAPKLLLGSGEKGRARLETQDEEMGTGQRGSAAGVRTGGRRQDGQEGLTAKENALLRRAETTSWDMFRERRDESQKERSAQVFVESAQKIWRAEGEGRRGGEREGREDGVGRPRRKPEESSGEQRLKQADSAEESPSLSCSLYSSVSSGDERSSRASAEHVASPSPLFYSSGHAERFPSSPLKPSVSSAPAAFSASSSPLKSPSSSLYYSPLSSATGDSRVGAARASPQPILSPLPASEREDLSYLQPPTFLRDTDSDDEDRHHRDTGLPTFVSSSSSSSQLVGGQAPDRCPSAQSPCPKLVSTTSRLAFEEQVDGEFSLPLSLHQGSEEAPEHKGVGLSPRISACLSESKNGDEKGVSDIRKTSAWSQTEEGEGPLGRGGKTGSAVRRNAAQAGQGTSPETKLESAEPLSCQKDPSEKTDGGELSAPRSEASSRVTSRLASPGALASILKAPSLSAFPFCTSQTSDLLRSYEGLHGQEWKSKAAPLLSSEQESGVSSVLPLSHMEEKSSGPVGDAAASSSRTGGSDFQYPTGAADHTAGNTGERGPEREDAAYTLASADRPGDRAQQQEERQLRRGLVFQEPEKDDTKSARPPGEFQRRRGKTASVCMPAWSSPSSRREQTSVSEGGEEEEKAEGRRDSGGSSDIYASLPTIQVSSLRSN